MDTHLPTPPPVDRTDVNLPSEFENKPICDEMLDWFLNNKQAKSLNMTPSIVKTMGKLIQCKHSVNYLCDKDKEIKHCYDHHYIKNQKYFDLMDELDSFVLSILMYKYH
jgi:hypothetical protein